MIKISLVLCQKLVHLNVEQQVLDQNWCRKTLKVTVMQFKVNHI